MLLHCGLDEKKWSGSMECYCDLRHVQDLLAAGKTPCERLFGEPFEGQIIPFGAIPSCIEILAGPTSPELYHKLKLTESGHRSCEQVVSLSRIDYSPFDQGIEDDPSQRRRNPRIKHRKIRKSLSFI